MAAMSTASANIPSEDGPVPSSSSSPRHDTLPDSISSSTHEAVRRAGSTTPGTSFTFVVNSQASAQASFDSAGNPDRFAHTRTKRKRTSPEDFAILEREYEKEPRPDRALRGRIALEVALNEKEVQIWFQNRRQMTRRKARTWQPNEISNIIYSSTQHTGSASPEQQEPMSSQDFGSSQSSTTEKSEERVNDRPGSGVFANASIVSFESPSQSQDRSDGQPEEASVSGEHAAVGAEAAEDAVETAVAATQTAQKEENEETQANDAPISDLEEHVQTSTRPAPSKKPRNQPRLRMSLEGKAEIVIDKNTPSPPSKESRRESWPARTPLQRSQSAITPTTPSLDQTATDAPSSSQPNQPWNRPRPVGHSRDARTWEFYCDSDTRDALSIAAEHDRKGLAQGALGLLRSNSGSAKHKLTSSALRPSLHKQNSNLKPGSDIGLSKTGSKRKSLDDMNHDRPKLARTASSLARLETEHIAIKALKSLPLPSIKSTKKKVSNKKADLEIFEDPDTDSDKENWAPGTRVSVPSHPHRPVPGVASRQILGTNLREISHESSLGALLSSKNVGNFRRKQRMSQVPQLDGAAGADGEIAAFMGEGSAVAEGEDLSAVQSLLNLSRGGRW